MMILMISMLNRREYERQNGAAELKRRLEELTACPVRTMHYADANPGTVNAAQPKAIFITGSPDPWPSVRVGDLYGLNDLLRTTAIPLLAVCQGHQLIGHSFNRELRKVRRLPDEPMRRLRPGELDTGAIYGHPGYYYADAFVAVDLLHPDPILAGLPRRIRVRADHWCEIKKLPRGFIHLARSAECAYEMIRHGLRPLYGLQFHAECWQKPYLAGRRILLNFFRLAGALEP
ncbi:MAG: gamma-glutamyl-gamma-aminobutyrate hydrolase family protein [Lentisphaerae bacterium]|nr:gamma-glutamyl-gamma-aminobutyrate hydrolase family protein [Lentisphaerota bacterium]